MYKNTISEMLSDRNVIGTKVYYHERHNKITIDDAKKYIATGYTNLIIVYDQITGTARKLLDLVHDKNIELFNYNELMYNITKHHLVPKHTKLSSEERLSFVSTYGDNIPIIKKTDPVSRYWCFKPGDIIRINRNDGTISYRIVRE